MGAFARARTKSIFARLWPGIHPYEGKHIINDSNGTNKSESIEAQKSSFLEALKKGGVWLS